MARSGSPRIIAFLSPKLKIYYKPYDTTKAIYMCLGRIIQSRSIGQITNVAMHDS